MAVNTNFQIPFIPQEGITAQILSAIQAANEQHFQQQRLDVLRQGQQLLAQQRQSQAGLNEARIQNLQAKTQGIAATQDSLNGYRDAKANLANVQAAFQQETDPIKKAALQSQLTLTQAAADQAATRVKFMHNAFHSLDDQIDTAITDPQQNAGAKAVVDNYMQEGNPEKALGALQHFVELAGKPELEAAVQTELAKTPQAQTRMALQRAQTAQAATGATKNLAEANKDNASAAAGNAYTAYDPARNERRYATQAELANPALGLQAPMKLTPTEFGKHVTTANALNDAQRDLSTAVVAYSKFGNLNTEDNAAVAHLISDDGFKAHFLGATVPVDWLNQLTKEQDFQIMSPTAQQATVAYMGLRTAAPAYTRALLNSGRQSDKIMQLEEGLLASPILPQEVRQQMLGRFQSKIDTLSQTIPEIPGVPRPHDIRQSIQTQPVINNMNMIMDRLGQNAAPSAQQAPGAGGLSGYVPPQQ